MTLHEHIEYWKNTSNDDFEVFNILYNNGNYLHALFLAHLSIEKIVKAHWVKDNNNKIPPKTHNLTHLIKQTKLKLSEETLKFLTLFNDFQLQGRYPDYKFKIKQLLTKEYVDRIVKQFIEIRICLLDSIT